ncbi:hypothetical protein pb186bvf_001460 [Paramecium bursaria]
MQLKFEKWIKIRIGEPITGLDCDNSNVIFGAITGYVGFYQIDTLELKYIPEVFEEIIRQVRIEKHKTYIIVGDIQALEVDNNTREIRNIKFENRIHNSQICSSSLSLYEKGKVLLLAVAPTQNKEIAIDIATKKNSLYLMNLQRNEMNSYFVDMPMLGIPFHFDGEKLLMLEYLKDAKKRISMLNFENQPHTIDILLQIDPKVEFISYCKFYLENKILYVENHRKVIIYDLQSKQFQQLHQMPSQIIGLDLQGTRLTILDYDGNVVVFIQEKLVIEFNIMKIPQVPQDIIKHKYIFDMGYPYYIRNCGGRIVLSSDLEICSLKSQKIDTKNVNSSVSKCQVFFIVQLLFYRRSNIPQYEPKSQSIQVQRDVKRNFFNESPSNQTQKTNTDESYQHLLHEIQLGQSDQVIKKLESSTPQTKHSYLLLSIAHKSNQNYDKARTYLMKSIKEFPNQLDTYFQLGNLELRAGKIQEAIKFFDYVIQVNPSDKSSLIQKAKCLSILKLHKQALDIYEKLRDSEFSTQIRHAQCLIKCGQIDQALNKLEGVLIQDPENLDALHFKGVVLFKKHQLLDSCLIFEQVIQLSHQSQLTSRSIYFIIKLKILQKDFYQAQLNLQRAQNLKRQQPYMVRIGHFINGTISLMKRNYRRGLDHFLEIKNTGKFLRPIYNQYLGYAYFCVSDYQNAVHQYTVSPIQDEGVLYNKLLCEALIMSSRALYNQSLQYLDKANQIFPYKLEPIMYKLTILVQRDKLNALKQCEYLIDQCFQLQGKQANLFYIRAIIKSCNRKFTSAVKDLDKAIDKSEENQYEHFYLRGIIHGQSMRLKQAIKDFSTSIHFNLSHAYSYLERAKCYQIIQENEQSLNDMKRFINLCKNTNESSYWTGSLLFHNNQFEEALKQYEQCDINRDILQLKLKCCIKTQQLAQAVEYSQQIILEKNIKDINDHYMLLFIKSTVELASKKNEEKTFIKLELLESVNDQYGSLFKEQDFKLLKASALIYLKKPQESIDLFQQIDDFWIKIQGQRQQTGETARDIDSSQSEELQNEMILKAERIVQHIISVKYNLLILNLMIHKYKNALKIYQDIRNQIGAVQSEELDYLHQFILFSVEKKQVPQFNKMMTFLMAERSVFNYFPTLRIQCANGFFDCKLSIHFPDIQPPNICPTFNKQYILKIRPQIVENKPEAPWLQRQSNFNVIFTQNMITQDIQLTTEEDSPKQKKKSIYFYPNIRWIRNK